MSIEELDKDLKMDEFQEKMNDHLGQLVDQLAEIVDNICPPRVHAMLAISLLEAMLSATKPLVDPASETGTKWAEISAAVTSLRANFIKIGN